ncbi:hypothetical protein CVT24_004004 [Panaeolus cyanescens]|uniref:Uncharacterized protein n=1 Tax=Panaeolus cyanescens TaxID=181874 RepID=A0A409Y6C9_9AGAR|nr:hypothetical protein CVT24_004004 [Panaeolus cyanescens]
MSSDNKIPLPQYLKVLTAENMPMSKAIAFAGKVYKSYNTTETIAGLTDAKLRAAGVESQEERRTALAAFKKAAFRSQAQVKTKSPVIASPSSPIEGPTSHATVLSPCLEAQITPTKRKRKRQQTDVNEFLPNEPISTEETEENFDFGEVLDEEILRQKTVVINRAPIMMAWAMVVAERLHFSRAEALSIASVYTELNALTKGISLGLYHKDVDRGEEAPKDGAQPPLYKTQSGQWRALSNGEPSQPSSAYSYLSRSFRQTTPHIIGALRLLADSYDEKELNIKAWSLYADFRPSVKEWGKRSEVRYDVILGLRKQKSKQEQVSTEANSKMKIPDVRLENATHVTQPTPPNDVPPAKKSKMTLEEYEALLDSDSTFDNVDLNF